MADFEFRQCEWQECRFRFPVELAEARSLRCPLCGAATDFAGEALAANGSVDEPGGLVLTALLDNIRSIHNVGSMFRTAEGAGIHHLYLCGMTTTPANLKLGKAALGAQENVPWTYAKNGVDMAQELKKSGRKLWAIETSEGAEPFFGAQLEYAGQRVTLVVGNERAGVDPGILELCDRVLSLPMSGQKRSLNVAVAFGIASYHLRYLPTLNGR